MQFGTERKFRAELENTLAAHAKRETNMVESKNIIIDFYQWLKCVVFPHIRPVQDKFEIKTYSTTLYKHN